MTSPPVFITGLGVVSAAGTGCEATLKNFRTRRRSIATAAVGCGTRAIDKPVFPVKETLPGDSGNDMRTVRLACLAADEALNDAGFPSDRFAAAGVGVCMGTTVACQLNDIDFYLALRTSGGAPMAAVDRYLRSNLAAAVAGRYGFKGPVTTVTNACSSGTDAIGVALGWLRAGLCEMALAGGADELNRVPLAGFNALGIMSDAPCMPFDRERCGLNLGEGAGVLLLETAASVARRGVARNLICAGYGTEGDAYHLTAPREDGSGLEAAVSRALCMANLVPAQIGFVNAHATATQSNDFVEGSVLARVFGENCLVSATKGFTGHTLGAAGAQEAVFTALGLREGWIPASAGFVNRDPAIPLAPVQGATTVSAHYALSTSLAFGGNNSALILGKMP